MENCATQFEVAVKSFWYCELDDADVPPDPPEPPDPPDPPELPEPPELPVPPDPPEPPELPVPPEPPPVPEDVPVVTSMFADAVIICPSEFHATGTI